MQRIGCRKAALRYDASHARISLESIYTISEIKYISEIISQLHQSYLTDKQLLLRTRTTKLAKIHIKLKEYFFLLATIFNLLSAYDAAVMIE